MEDIKKIAERLDRIEAKLDHLLAGAAESSPTFVDTQGAAEITGLSKFTLEQWRSEGKGPQFTRVGRAVRYAVADLAKFMAEGKIDGIRMLGCSEPKTMPASFFKGRKHPLES